MEISTGKKLKSRWEKLGKLTLAPPPCKISLLRPWCHAAVSREYSKHFLKF